MNFQKKAIKWFTTLFLAVVLLYGAGRIYYYVTHGFTIGNITFAHPYDSRWDVRPLFSKEKTQVDQVLAQKFYYLGKGCQSYVFLSADGNYVIKFFKYQRFRVQPWLETLSFIPVIDALRLSKAEKKQKKLEGVYSSWKIAFDELKPETGLLFVHLNKTDHLNKMLTLYDKMGFEHHVNLDHMEFLIQRKAKMLTAYIRELMEGDKVKIAQQLLDRIITLILSEYKRGFADNDHALMQNTGVLDGKPIHIDVGQFIKDDDAKNPQRYKQELFNKMYKFRKWLSREYPELADYLENRLHHIIGEQFYQMQPHFKPHE